MDAKTLVSPLRQDIGDEPSIFLGGAITGADDWQSEAIRMLRAFGFDGWIFNPRRKRFPNADSKAFEEQVDWEREHLKRATVILFWLPAKNSQGKIVHGRTSRWEMAEFVTRRKKLVVGIEDNFRGKRYMEYVLRKDFSKNALICSSLEEVCRTAAAIAKAWQKKAA